MRCVKDGAAAAFDYRLSAHPSRPSDYGVSEMRMPSISFRNWGFNIALLSCNRPSMPLNALADI